MSSSKTINISPQLFNVKAGKPSSKPSRKHSTHSSNKMNKTKLMNRLRQHMRTQKNHTTPPNNLSKFDTHLSYFQKLNKERKKTRSRNKTENVHSALPADMKVSTPAKSEPTNSASHYSIKAAPEYGILKGSTKPTMREWKRLTQKNPPTIPSSTEPSSITIPKPVDILSAPIIPILPNKPAPIAPIAPNNHIKPSPIAPIAPIKPANRKTFLLGKRNNKIGILIKNNTTRKRIKDEINILNDAPIFEVKEYLKKHHLYKSGNNTPQDLLREIYKCAHLAGKPVKNLSGENLLHNFYKL